MVNVIRAIVLTGPGRPSGFDAKSGRIDLFANVQYLPGYTKE
jgi:hypothetical protein